MRLKRRARPQPRDAMLIDSHVNLHGEAFAGELEDVIARARAAGVVRMIAICARLQDFSEVAAIAEAHDDIWCTIGAHPHHAKDKPDVTADELLEIAKHPKVVALGETGLDFYYNHSPEDQQRTSFAAHVEAARRADLPIVIHCRDADDAMADLLEELWADGPFRFLLHSYTGGADLARRGAALGGTFSINGIASFKNASAVRDVFRDTIPDDRIILETDAPYLAPVPYRGRRNEPAYLVHVADTLADIKGWSREETEKRTSEAFFALFHRVPRPAAASQTSPQGTSEDAS